jgi:hypothetical protein
MPHKTWLASLLIKQEEEEFPQKGATDPFGDLERRFKFGLSPLYWFTPGFRKKNPYSGIPNSFLILNVAHH